MNSSFDKLRRGLPGLLLGLALIVWPARSQAVPLPASGQAVSLTGTSLSGSPELAGQVVAQMTSPFNTKDVKSGQTLSGSVTSQVIREAGGTLDFYYQFTNTSADPLADEGNGAILTGFNSQQLDVNFRTDLGGSVNPASALLLPGGNAIKFSWANTPIGQGQSTAFFFVRTNATGFAQNNAFTVFNTDTTEPMLMVSSFAPNAPEPVTLALVGFGLAGLVMSRVRRTRRTRPHSDTALRAA